jgi:hypothetical protein
MRRLFVELDSIMWEPRTFDDVVERIVRCVSTDYGPLHEQELQGVPGPLQIQILPFALEHHDGSLNSEEKKVTLVKKVVASFLRECLAVELGGAHGID